MNYKMIILIMGIRGSGKTTIGKLLSEETQINYYDADDFHPQSNIHKMTNNIPLTDKDRLPWLESLAKKIAIWESSGGAILACSALKEDYRKILSSASKNVFWVYLSGSYNLIKSRIENRTGHFMNTSLLESQFHTLEAPNYGLEISIEHPPKEIINRIISKLKTHE